jgi:hypothetical protein
MSNKVILIIIFSIVIIIFIVFIIFLIKLLRDKNKNVYIYDSINYKCILSKEKNKLKSYKTLNECQKENMYDSKYEISTQDIKYLQKIVDCQKNVCGNPNE